MEWGANKGADVAEEVFVEEMEEDEGEVVERVDEDEGGVEEEGHIARAQTCDGDAALGGPFDQRAFGQIVEKALERGGKSAAVGDARRGFDDLA